MHKFRMFAVGLCVAGLFAGGAALAQNRGRIQIQGPDIADGTLSSSWTLAVPITKKEGRQRLATLENQLTAAQKSARTAALASAIAFIDSCPVAGCNTATRSWPGTATRVDIEIIEGIAFTGTPPQ